MERVKREEGRAIDWVGLLLDKQDEIVEWINEHEKYVQPLEKAWKEAIEQTLEQAKKRGEHG